MPYTIHKSDGTPVDVPEPGKDVKFYTGAIPPGTGKGIILIGRNEIDYGASIAQNFLQLTENFASPAPPPGDSVLQGQLWYDTVTKQIYVRSTPGVPGADDLTNWDRIITIPGGGGGAGGLPFPIINPGAGTEKNGDLKITNSPPKAEIWIGGAWRQIFPPVYGAP